MMAIIFPMIYSIIVGNNLVAKKIDDGSMAGYLSTPVPRRKIIMSNALYFAAFLLQFAISGICFASSCIFNRSKHSLLLGAGLPLGFFVLSLLVKTADSLKFLKYITLTSLYDTSAILTGGTFVPQFVLLGVLSVGLYAFAIAYFNKKNLPL